MCLGTQTPAWPVYPAKLPDQLGPEGTANPTQSADVLTDF
jgi:hypothetical protein